MLLNQHQKDFRQSKDVTYFYIKLVLLSCRRRKGGQVLFNSSHSDYEAGHGWMQRRLQRNLELQVVAQAAAERGWRVVKCEEKAW